MAIGLAETAPPSGAEADAALVRAVAAGDARACRDLLERHLDRVIGLAYRLLGERSAAEDVAQDTFLRLWSRAAAWRPDARLDTWLYTVARNLCLDRLRKAGREIDAPLPELPDPAPSAERLIDEARTARRVAEEIAALPERQRSAISLVHEEGLSNIDAAAILGVSVEALESLLARARRRLRERLTETGEVSGGGRAAAGGAP
ncbi:RNA polymerase sigma-70 factor, ECF subfamily [Tistlia consotensis]|uniref:RNA polymerase sigma-70 factor, ECF subfamily n=1 Tax=Tistlia consotensis USBA 355 TaxID=560819 RepID=A0A1Y6B9K4_9PROT|nr:RNA polymerase sigma factor [Tistlia consotensis]SME91814.1 RNA polymerase sigma-70 factor, ECF subfamily [Tistlia consotensis USBA 355]SNR27644.1 RNA polymerase sigma-70 factor, ECF subfamily [Tistlia consotensis]